ncbi:unnamed protein product, partial [Durusdinium trenchii]
TCTHFGLPSRVRWLHGVAKVLTSDLKAMPGMEEEALTVAGEEVIDGKGGLKKPGRVPSSQSSRSKQIRPKDSRSAAKASGEGRVPSSQSSRSKQIRPKDLRSAAKASGEGLVEGLVVKKGNIKKKVEKTSQSRTKRPSEVKVPKKGSERKKGPKAALKEGAQPEAQGAFSALAAAPAAAPA